MEDGEIDLPIILPVLPGMQNNLRDQDMGLAEVDLKISIKKWCRERKIKLAAPRHSV